MKNIQAAVAAHLEGETGVKTVCGRSNVRGEYPLLAVSAEEQGTVLLAGGRLAEHAYEVTVTAAADRERTGNPALLSGLVPLLLGGIPMEQNGERRVLHPLNIRVEEDRVCFSLEVCAAVESPFAAGETPAEAMKTLHFGV